MRTDSWKRLRAVVVARWELLRARPEAGYSTETVIVTALLVVLALAVLAIIATKVTAAANGITL